jgi:hypothetical protein
MAPATRKTAALVLAGCTALALSAATGATAATLITGKQIKDGTVTGADLKNGTVKSADIGDGTVTGTDVKNGSIGAADLGSAVADSLAGGRIPSGVTVTGSFTMDIESDTSGDYRVSVDLPGSAGKQLGDTDVNFGPDGTGRVVDGDATCTGSWSAPTAPSGKVCLYQYSATDDTTGLEGWQAVGAKDRGFRIKWFDNAAESADVLVNVVWAYTAP